MINSKSVLALIPARGGSKGIPRKNLYQFQGQSLLARAISVAKTSQYIDSIVVSSEDAEIIHEAKLYGASTPFIRPTELAKDDTSSVDVVIHALSQLRYYDYILLLQVTSPLRNVKDIDLSIAYCIQHCAPACMSIVKVDKHPFWMVSVTQDGTLRQFNARESITRRQDLPDIYLPNGAIYIAETTWFLKNKTFLTDKTVGFIMPKDRSVDIDSEKDLHILKMYAELYKKNKQHEQV